MSTIELSGLIKRFRIYNIDVNKLSLIMISMSDSRHTITDLRGKYCLAGNKRFYMPFSDARNEHAGSVARKISHRKVHESQRDREVGRNSANAVIASISRFFGGPGWNAKMIILQPVNESGTTSAPAWRNVRPAAAASGKYPTTPSLVGWEITAGGTSGAAAFRRRGPRHIHGASPAPRC
jgi:hypothetical protein